jgi:hypothetical protein
MSITLSAWVKKTPVTAAVQVSGALSVSFSYWQIFGARNVEGIADAMHQLRGVPVGLVMTLKSVDWHEVNSCGGGFCFAAHEAMFSTRRILQVPGAKP